MAENLESARALALRMLARRAYGEAQMRARLRRAGFEREAEEVLHWLVELGYLNDAAYARDRARTLVSRGLGPDEAMRRLAGDGVPAELARGAVRAFLDEGVPKLAGEDEGREPAELLLCRAAAARKLKGRDPKTLDLEARARLVRFLVGRGFSPEAAARAADLPEDAPP
ncbi:MAG TPA: regulatory protein RecX [Anaeromyxobacteraceae bacterium]|nr:regulatory protein RecX [Anaeromyxobacteraceae bacterium]